MTTLPTCEECHAVVNPARPGIVTAYVQAFAQALEDEEAEALDGLEAYFHERCFPHWDPAYRRV
jgi:hypothetical protein